MPVFYEGDAIFPVGKHLPGDIDLFRTGCVSPGEGKAVGRPILGVFVVRLRKTDKPEDRLAWQRMRDGADKFRRGAPHPHPINKRFATPPDKRFEYLHPPA